MLGDIVGPASRGLCMGENVRKQLEAATGYPVPGRSDDGRGLRSGTGSCSCATCDGTREPSLPSPGRSRRATLTPPLAELGADDSNVDWLALGPVGSGDGRAAPGDPRPRRREWPRRDRSGAGRRRRGRPRRPRGFPTPLCPPARARGRARLDGPYRTLAGGGGRGVRGRRGLVPRAALDRHRERLLARSLQRRRRCRREGRSPADGGRISSAATRSCRSVPPAWPRWTRCTP